MAMLKSLFYLLIMLVFIVAGLLFSFRNDTLIEVDLLFTQIPSLSVGFWLLSSLILGVLLGMILVFPKRISQSLKIQRLSRSVNETKLAPSHTKTESNKG